MGSFLSLEGLSVEYIPEYAKELVYKGTLPTTNPFLLSSNQYELLKSMNDKVDIVISDTHILNSIIYMNLPKYKQLITDEQRVRLRNQLMGYNQKLPGLTIRVISKMNRYIEEGRLEKQEELEEISTLMDEFLDDDTITFVNKVENYECFMMNVKDLGDRIIDRLFSDVK